MVTDGTSLVEVEAISFDEQTGDRPTRVSSAESSDPDAAPLAATAANRVFIQIGAFSSRENADQQLGLLRAGGIGTGFVLADMHAEPPIYRVRVGPISGVAHYDLLIVELDKLGIVDPYLVTE